MLPAFNNPAALQDPIATAVQALVSAKQQVALTAYQTAQRKAEAAYKRLSALNPNDATTQIQLGQAAQAANDTAVAVAAYRKFLRLAPNDPLAAQVKRVLNSLAAGAGASTTTGG